MICRDALTKELNRNNYSVVRLPRAGLAPLQIYRLDALRTYIGDVGDLWKSDRPLDRFTIEDRGTAALAVSETDKLRTHTGLQLLEGVFSRLKFWKSAELRAEYEKASSIKLVFESPTYRRVKLTQLGDYLVNGDINWRNPVVRDSLLPDGPEVIVITEVLQSTSITVEAFDRRGAVIELNPLAIEGLGSGDLKIEAAKERAGRVTYRGVDPVSFAFKACRIQIIDGMWTLEGINPRTELSDQAGDVKELPPLDGDGLAWI